jgi:hypothetical protein
MHIVSPSAAASILAIAAHPDDIESWCAGTLAVAIDRGAIVRLLLVTSGDAGADDPAATRESVAARLAHRSQTADSESLIANWRRRFAAICAEANVPLAEAFTILHLE